MRLGIVARSDQTGLGIQTKAYYDHLKPAKTMVVDISMLDPMPERRMTQHPEWYPDATFIYGIPSDGQIREFLQDLDVVLIAESSYNMNFYQIARDMGVKTANVYNFEFFDWFKGSMWHNQTPDLFIAPSTWHYYEVDELCKEKGLKHAYLHLPVDRSEITRRQIDSARLFVHIAGRPATHDRNGTYTFLHAIKISDGLLKGVVYTQNRQLADDIKRDFPIVKVVVNLKDYREMYKKGAVLVLPRKYGGNCLPLNEALCAGMPVIMSKVSPQTDFLPDKWLVAAKKTDIEFAPRFPIDVYEVSPYELMIKMLWFKSLSSQDMREQSDIADELADSISWETMQPKYIELLDALCQL